MEIENQQISIHNHQELVQDSQNCCHDLFNLQRSYSLSSKFKAFILLQLSEKNSQKTSQFQLQNNSNFIYMRKQQAFTQWRFLSTKDKTMKKQVSNIICKQKLSPQVFFYRLKNLISNVQLQQRKIEQYKQIQIENKIKNSQIGVQVFQILSKGIIKSAKSLNDNQQMVVIAQSKQNNDSNSSKFVDYMNQEDQKQQQIRKQCQKIDQEQVEQIIYQTKMQPKCQKNKTKKLPVSELRLKQNSAIINKLKKQMALQFNNIKKIGFKIEELQTRIDKKINQRESDKQN